jgi:hypothetical protein
MPPVGKYILSHIKQQDRARAVFPPPPGMAKAVFAGEK